VFVFYEKRSREARLAGRDYVVSWMDNLISQRKSRLKKGEQVSLSDCRIAKTARP